MSKIFNHRSLFSSFKSASLASSVRYGLNLDTILLPNIYYCNKRFLYSREHLGLVSFSDQRSKITSQFGHLKDNLLERLKQSVEGKSRMIFSEDLKNAIFLASDDQADLDILKDVIAKYSDQSNDIKFSPYQFGPVVMRLLHVFNKPDLAFEFLMEEKYGDFFKRERAFLVAMDLCWNNGKFDEIIKLYDRFESQISQDGSAKRTWYTDLFVLTTGACYRLNTPESYKIATDKVLARRAREEILGARSTCFFAALALNQNEPDVALECLSTMPRTRSALQQTLKLMCLASLKRLDDVIYSIKNVMNAEILPAKAFVLAEAIDMVDRAMDASANPETKEEWNRLGQALRDNNMISSDTIDSRLCKEIESRMILRTSDRKSLAFGQPGEPRGDRGYSGQRYNRYRVQRSGGPGGPGERFSRYDDRFQNDDSRYGNRRMNQYSGGYSNQRSRNYFGDEGFNDRRSRDNFEDSDGRQPQRRQAQGSGRYTDDD